MLRLLTGLFLILQLLAGCASLPDYALPRVGKGGDIGEWSEIIRYRKLEVADFRASSLSDEYRKHAFNLQAYTRVVIRPRGNSRYTINATNSFNQVVYHGGIELLSFEALLIPEASWWSPKISPEKTAYVLQHEQIHFALMEAAARRMTREVKEDTSLFTCFGTSRQEVIELLENKISEYMKKNLDEAVAKHTVFDTETSLYHDPKAQQRWYEKVMEQLEEN